MYILYCTSFWFTNHKSIHFLLLQKTIQQFLILSFYKSVRFRFVLVFGVLLALLCQFQIGQSAVLYGTVGDTIYQHGVPKVSFIEPEDGSERLVYQYPDPSTAVEKVESLKTGSRVSYEFVKSVQPGGYTVRDKAVNIQYV